MLIRNIYFRYLLLFETLTFWVSELGVTQTDVMYRVSTLFLPDVLTITNPTVLGKSSFIPILCEVA